MKLRGFVVIIIPQPWVTISAFIVPPHHDGRRIEELASLASTATTSSVATDVKLISICTEELCQCQGEYEYTGGAADAALEQLQKLDLPCPLDSVGCMGACGMGTMIAIDYKNGDSILVDGLQSTLIELGLQQEQTNSQFDASTPEPEDVVIENESSCVEEEVTPSTPTVIVATSTTNASPEPVVEQKETVVREVRVEPKKSMKQRRELVDVRDRMREEAADQQVENPWLKMGSYLAKKATDNMFGSGSE